MASSASFPKAGGAGETLPRPGGGVARDQRPRHDHPTACLGTRATGEHADSWPRVRSRLVVDFGAPVVLELPDGIPGRQRLHLAGEQVRLALAGHVAEASRRHGIPCRDIPRVWSGPETERSGDPAAYGTMEDERRPGPAE